MNEPSRQPLDSQGVPEPGESIGSRPRVALAGYAILSLVLAVIGFTELVVPGLVDRGLTPPSLLGWTTRAGGLWGVASALAVVFGFLGIAQIVQEERRGLMVALLGLLLGVWGLLAFLSRAGWFQIF